MATQGLASSTYYSYLVLKPIGNHFLTIDAPTDNMLQYSAVQSHRLVCAPQVSSSINHHFREVSWDLGSLRRVGVYK